MFALVSALTATLAPFRGRRHLLITVDGRRSWSETAAAISSNRKRRLARELKKTTHRHRDPRFPPSLSLSFMVISIFFVFVRSCSTPTPCPAVRLDRHTRSIGIHHLVFPVDYDSYFYPIRGSSPSPIMGRIASSPRSWDTVGGSNNLLALSSLLDPASRS